MQIRVVCMMKAAVKLNDFPNYHVFTQICMYLDKLLSSINLLLI